MASALESQLLLLSDRLERAWALDGVFAQGREVSRKGGLAGSASRVASGSSLARRVSPSCHGSGVLHEGHVGLVSSAADPQDGQRSAGVTVGL